MSGPFLAPKKESHWADGFNCYPKTHCDISHSNAGKVEVVKCACLPMQFCKLNKGVFLNTICSLQFPFPDVINSVATSYIITGP